MAILQNKHILLGVTGGIAAYKSAELVRRLREGGAEVRVVMTTAAREFITPLTMQALSGNPVHTDMLDPSAEAAMGHIELARWADLVLIAPATADFLARLAQGRGDDLLSTLCLASRSPIAVAPAMNQGMWGKAATQDNLEVLRRRQVRVFGPGSGSQACGDVGEGRMLEPEELAYLAGSLFERGTLDGKVVVITAGPTREALDPVRYLSNHSSGKMGYALATAAVEAGARTLLISGPTNLPPPERVEFIAVVSAQQMWEAALRHAPESDLFIAAAAVADYRPAQVAAEKIKKSDGDEMTLHLVKNPDIVAAVARLPGGPFTVGFAAETEALEDHARTKLTRKNLDLIVANDVSDPTIGFNSENNAVTLIDASSSVRLDQRAKSQLARDIIAHVASRLAPSSSNRQ